MPNYDYKCTACGHELEVFQKISDKPIKDCPKCKSSTLEKCICGSSTSFQFKGSGFYITDYPKECGKGDCCK